MTYLLSFKMRAPLDVPVETAGTSKNPMRKFALLSFGTGYKGITSRLMCRMMASNSALFR